ncbi:hypothetical protein HQQ81_05690 [Microbacteriaceae bacterium VKM Ac-2854]|nr:hypothetical protein [Microbacteriaceae bacterium VKM Ac-2854]
MTKPSESVRNRKRPTWDVVSITKDLTELAVMFADEAIYADSFDAHRLMDSHAQTLRLVRTFVERGIYDVGMGQVWISAGKRIIFEVQLHRAAQAFAMMRHRMAEDTRAIVLKALAAVDEQGEVGAEARAIVAEAAVNLTAEDLRTDSLDALADELDTAVRSASFERVARATAAIDYATADAAVRAQNGRGVTAALDGIGNAL